MIWIKLLHITHADWLLVIGYWLLVIGYWLLVIGYWLLVIGYWLLSIIFLCCKNIIWHPREIKTLPSIIV